TLYTNKREKKEIHLMVLFNSTVSRTTHTLYADDTSPLISDKDNTTVSTKCNNNLQVLHSWFTVNSLVLNVSKTNFIRFHKHQNKNDMHINIKLNDTSLERVKYTKFLGLYIDETLNCKIHCTNLCAKLNTVVFL